MRKGGFAAVLALVFGPAIYQSSLHIVWALCLFVLWVFVGCPHSKMAGDEYVRDPFRD